MKFTALHKSKLLHMFQLLDVDSNGVIEYQDFRMAMDTLVLEKKLDQMSPRYLDLVTANKSLWKMLVEPLDLNFDGEISQSEWLAFHIKAFLLEPSEGGLDPEFSLVMKATAKFFCELLDIDGDGVVTLENYVSFCGSYRVGENEAVIGFSMFDRDRNQQLSVEEVAQLVREFYLSPDPEAPGNLFFGAF